MSPVLEVTDLTLQAGGRTLIENLSFTVEQGSSLAIMGRSGVGKTTLLRTILGLKRFQTGTIHLANINVGTARQGTLATMRLKQVGMVFQDARLLPGLTALQNVAIPALLAKEPRNTAVERARALLNSFDVPPNTLAEVLSGGEAQRTGLARALMNSPQLLLADEPTGSLDEELKDHVADHLFTLPHQRNCALVVVTHDRTIATRANHTIHLTHQTPAPT